MKIRVRSFSGASCLREAHQGGGACRGVSGGASSSSSGDSRSLPGSLSVTVPIPYNPPSNSHSPWKPLSFPPNPSIHSNHSSASSLPPSRECPTSHTFDHSWPPFAIANTTPTLSIDDATSRTPLTNPNTSSHHIPLTITNRQVFFTFPYPHTNSTGTHIHPDPNTPTNCHA